MGRIVTFPIAHGMARGYLARSVAQTGDGVLVVDSHWREDTEHHPRCDALAARGMTALVVDLHGEEDAPHILHSPLATLVEAIEYLRFHPSVQGRPVFVDGDPALIDALTAAGAGLPALGLDP